MIELVRAGRRPEELAKEFEPSAQAIRNLVTQADRDEGRWADGLTTAEREELIRDHPIVTFRRARDRATSQAHRIFCMEGKHMKTHLASAIVVAGLFALASSQAFAWTCVADNSNPRAGFRAGTGSGTGSSEAEARQRALGDCTELRGPGCRIAWCRPDPRDRARGTRLPQVDRSTSSSPDTRFWRFVRDDGSCAVYVHRQTGQRRTFCDY